MKIKNIRKKILLVFGKRVQYNKNNNKGKEGDKVTQMIEKLKGVQLPPHQLRELGLEKDWQKRVSPTFVDQIVHTAEKYKNALKKLSEK